MQFGGTSEDRPVHFTILNKISQQNVTTILDSIDPSQSTDVANLPLLMSGTGRGLV